MTGVTRLSCPKFTPCPLYMHTFMGKENTKGKHDFRNSATSLHYPGSLPVALFPSISQCICHHCPTAPSCTSSPLPCLYILFLHQLCGPRSVVYVRFWIVNYLFYLSLRMVVSRASGRLALVSL